MKRFRTVSVIRRLLLSMLAVLLLVDVAGELGWLSGLVTPLCRGRLLERGVDARIDRLSVGLIGGFRARGVTVYDPSRPESSVFEAEYLQASPDYGSLLKGRFRLARVQVKSGQVRIPRSLVVADDSRFLCINDIAVAASVTSDHIRIRGATASFSGISLSLSADVSDVDQFFSDGTAGVGDWVANGDVSAHGQGGVLDRLFRFIDQQTFPEAEANLDASVSISLANPQAARVSGSFMLPGIVWKGTSIRKFKGSFNWENHQFNLQPFSVFLDSKNLMFGQLQVDARTGTAAGDIQASLMVDMMLRHLNIQHLPVLNGLHAPVPMFCRLQFPQVPPKLEAFTGKVSAQLPHMSIAELNVNRISFEATCQNGILTTQKAVAELGDSPQEVVEAELTYAFADKSMQGEMQGRLRVVERLKQAGLLIMGDYVRHVAAAPVDRVDLTIHRSGGTAGRLQVQGRVNLNGLILGTQPLDHVNASFELADQQLSVTNLDVAVDSADQVVTLAKGQCYVNLAEQRMRADLSGKLLNDSAVRLLPVGRAQEVLSRFGSGQAEYEFSLKDSFWAPGQWTGELGIVMNDSSFETLAFEQLKAKVKLSPGVIQAVASAKHEGDGMNADVTMEIKTATRELMLSADGAMDLRQIRVFLPPVGRGRRVYDNIWKDFEWPPGMWPQIKIDSLHFIPRRRNRIWELELDGRVCSSQLLYRGMDLASLDCNVKLDLPAKVMITDMKAAHATGTATGEVKFFLRREPACHLSVQGVFSPDAVLGAMLPAWESYKQKIAFAADSEVNVEGKIPLRDKSKLELSGSVKAPFMTLSGMSFDDVKSRWGWHNHRLTVDLFEGNLCGGPTQATLDYQTETGNGLFSLAFEGVDLNELVCQFRPETKERNQGKLEGGVELTISRRVGDRQLLLTGPGSIRIVDGNIWEIPLFRKLGELLRLSPLKMLSNLGRIANLEADLEFKGDRVEVSNLTTDGTILSLKGAGNYLWPTQELDFRVRGVLLKRTLVIPLATKLLSWIFEAELGGTVKEPDWKLVSALRRTLFGGGKGELLEAEPADVDEESGEEGDSVVVPEPELND